MDGTLMLKDGNPIDTYVNSDIQTFARAWTGFSWIGQTRGNSEGAVWNRMDPMKINGNWRDFFPKMDLDGGYIGDGYPLCADAPGTSYMMNDILSCNDNDPFSNLELLIQLCLFRPTIPA